MPGKARFPVFIFSLLLIFLLQETSVYAQHSTILNKKISFTFTDMPLANVLRAISSKTGVRFSYNPDLIQPGRRISMRFNNLPLNEILKQLLADPSISWREIGNQIVLYRGNSPILPLEPNQQQIQGKPQIVFQKKKIPDTVFVYQLDTLIINRTDTIIRSVSLTHFDTIRIKDTIYIDKTAIPQSAPVTIADTMASALLLPPVYQTNRGLYAGLVFELLPGEAAFKSTASESDGFLTLLKQSNAAPLAKFSLGVAVGYDFSKLGFRTGIGLTQLGENFDFSYVVEGGGYYHTFIGDTFYTAEAGNLVPHYVYDSTWVPTDVRNFAFQNPNSYRYVDVPLSVKLRFWQRGPAELYALGGLNAAFLVSVNALQIVEGGKDVKWLKKSDLNPILFSWQAGIGTMIKFTPRAGLSAEATWHKQSTNQFKDFPIDKRYNLIGLKLAVYIKL